MTKSSSSLPTELLSSNELLRPLKIKRPALSRPNCKKTLFLQRVTHVYRLYKSVRYPTFHTCHQQGPPGPRGLPGPPGPQVSVFIQYNATHRGASRHFFQKRGQLEAVHVNWVRYYLQIRGFTLISFWLNWHLLINLCCM